jgi:mannose-6-phosphate isomerase-like protein (cupin superfamily)
MIEIWKEAKQEQKVLYFKKFQEPEITWEDTLKYIYELSLVEDKQLQERARNSGGSMITKGSVLFNFGYLIFNNGNLFSKFKGIREFMTKVNGGISGEECGHYLYNSSIPCTCDGYWHIQALRFSITDHSVLNHNDPTDVLYWQLLGNSRWIMNNDKEYLLEPGDLLYFNKEDSHQVLQDGPRAGIIIDANQKTKENK